MLLTFGVVSFGDGALAQGNRELSKREQAAHALSRLTFGARAGEVERVEQIGVDKWIAQQLKPDAIPDPAISAALSGMPAWTMDARQLRTAIANSATAFTAMSRSMAQPSMAQPGMAQPSMMADTVTVRRALPLSYATPANEFVAGKIIRAQISERQLDEVMTEFWLNHFSVFGRKMPAPEAIVVYERDVIRPNTLGKFRNLLGAVAHSPAMLYYLDNPSNRSDSLHRTLSEFRSGATINARTAASKRLGINENYARELMELHTLGVDGGYTQQDIINVARALTGWGTGPAAAGLSQNGAVFRFDDQLHDAEAKSVLGHALAEGRGVEDGEQVLDIIARHPSTARFIATKLARRFVSDTPPPSVIERAAATFSRTDGDIAETVRTIVTSPEFFSRAAFRSKVKSPMELMVSMRRALGAPIDTSVASARVVARLGHPAFGYETPEGWPDVASTWMNPGTMFGRLRFAQDVANARLKDLPTAGWEGWRTLASEPLSKQVDGVIGLLFGGVVDSTTRQLMLAVATPKEVMPGGTPSSARLRDLLELALSAPEFQRR